VEKGDEDEGWDWFISHCQAETAAIATDLYHTGHFEQQGLSVWLNVKMAEQDEEAMKKGVQTSRKFLTIASSKYFPREWCMMGCAGPRRPTGPSWCVSTQAKGGRVPCEMSTRLGGVNFISVNRSKPETFALNAKQILQAPPKVLT